MNKPRLNLEQVHALLDKLENDDAFRALFQADAAAGLARVGASIEAALCFGVKTLASKEVIRATRLALTSQLVGIATQQPHRLDASFSNAPAQILQPKFAAIAAA